MNLSSNVQKVLEFGKYIRKVLAQESSVLVTAAIALSAIAVWAAVFGYRPELFTALFACK